MLLLTKSEIDKQQQLLKKACEHELIQDLKKGKKLLLSFFPGAKLKIAHDGKSNHIEADVVFDYKINQIKNWISQVLEKGILIGNGQEFDEQPFDKISLTQSMSHLIIGTLLKIFTYGRDLCENDFYYINEVCIAMGIATADIHKIIEQSLYEVRKEFFQSLLNYLDDEDCYQCAILLIKAVRADDNIHPAEFKYIENISQLLKNDQSKLEKAEKDCNEMIEIPAINLNEELSAYMYKYLVEIVMCDGEFDARESEFLQDVATVFKYDKNRQDEIIQPVASTLMVKASLFPKE